MQSMIPIIYPWTEYELTFTARNAEDPYLEYQGWVDFTHESGQCLRRPMFWDGENRWKVRFASPQESGRWYWRSFCLPREAGLAGQTGEVQVSVDFPTTANLFQRRGFWRIPGGRRHLEHADGTPCLLCADTIWAFPWRATVEEAEFYALDRQKKGFNAALLMVIQPDRKTTGPEDRTAWSGFARAFDDLPQGSLRQLRPDYFQYLDRLIDVLVAHEIVPVYQPVFHGYGWRGGHTAGNSISREDMARFCRYLVARYGARPAMWLVGGDGAYESKEVQEQLDSAGREIERWDGYGQPCGIHYAPHATNCLHQDKSWLDFQWCQTGHEGEHVPERVADMWRNQPVKAVANGEPTYEEIGQPGRAADWWQGHEAWCNLCAGGTMGVVYGAGSLWGWRHDRDEPGDAEFCVARAAGWREALHFPGSRYPGILRRIFDGLPFAGMEPTRTIGMNRRALAVAGRLYVVYLERGGAVNIFRHEQVPVPYRVYDPKTGALLAEGNRNISQDYLDLHTQEPRVVVFAEFPTGR